MAAFFSSYCFCSPAFSDFIAFRSFAILLAGAQTTVTALQRLGRLGGRAPLHIQCVIAGRHVRDLGLDHVDVIQRLAVLCHGVVQLLERLVHLHQDFVHLFVVGLGLGVLEHRLIRSREGSLQLGRASVDILARVADVAQDLVDLLPLLVDVADDVQDPVDVRRALDVARQLLQLLRQSLGGFLLGAQLCQHAFRLVAHLLDFAEL